MPNIATKKYSPLEKHTIMVYTFLIYLLMVKLCLSQATISSPSEKKHFFQNPMSYTKDADKPFHVKVNLTNSFQIRFWFRMDQKTFGVPELDSFLGLLLLWNPQVMYRMYLNFESFSSFIDSSLVKSEVHYSTTSSDDLTKWTYMNMQVIKMSLPDSIDKYIRVEYFLNYETSPREVKDSSWFSSTTVDTVAFTLGSFFPSDEYTSR